MKFSEHKNHRLQASSHRTASHTAPVGASLLAMDEGDGSPSHRLQASFHRTASHTALVGASLLAMDGGDGSPSHRLQASSHRTASHTAPVGASLLAMGDGYGAVAVTETVATALSTLPSLTTRLNTYTPARSAVNVG